MKRRIISRCVTGAIAGLIALPVGAAHADDIEPQASSLMVLPGKDRYETAGMLATAAYTTSTTVVLASGLSFADALAASSLAGDFDAPILLLDGVDVPTGTASAYASLQPTNVVVVGGTQRISDEAVARLTGGTATVTRVAGGDRWQTAAAVAARLSEVGTIDGKRTAFLAVGDRFADAVAAGPAAHAGNLPVLLTSTTSLPDATRATLVAEKIEHVVVLGGQGAVSSAVADQVAALGISMERVQGSDRYATATAVADWSIDHGFLGDEQVLAVRGDDGGGGADALAGAPASSILRAPILLLADPDDPSEASERWMVEHSPRTVSMIIVGSWPRMAPYVLLEQREFPNPADE